MKPPPVRIFKQLGLVLRGVTADWQSGGDRRMPRESERAAKQFKTDAMRRRWFILCSVASVPTVSYSEE